MLSLITVFFLAGFLGISLGKIYVCEADDPKLLGIYEEGTKMDGVATYTNANE
jgi:hypothetical protein